MNDFVRKLKLTWSDNNLRRKIFFVLAILVMFRFGTSIPIPGVDHRALNELFQGSQFLGLLDIFSGGGLSNLSIFMLGVGPFITASIIMQLMTLISPALKEMFHEDGAVGRRKVAQYSRMLTVPLAMVQSFGLLTLLERQGILFDSGGITVVDRLFNVIIITAGAVLLMWMGELINEFGIGNGISLLIFAGIIAGLPTALTQTLLTFDMTMLPTYLGFFGAAVLIIAGVVIITEGERPVPITYAKRVRGSKMYGGISTYLPIRVNNAGVMPIIFALAILLFPQMVLGFLSQIDNNLLLSIVDPLEIVFNNTWFSSGLYFVLVFGFTYFYTAVTFDPKSISENLQKSGAFIPGIRPGKNTMEYLSKTLNRLTLVGAIFLGFVAMLPLLMQAATGVATFAIGGTSLLIVVSVLLDLIKKIDGQITMREY